jgi:RsiW-degrading membrane proteinase PrsW (M82 family)
MWQQMQEFFKSFFIYPGLSTELMLVSIGLAIAFGAIWLTCYWPPLFKKYWLWLVAAASAFLTLLAITFIQIPLQNWDGQALNHFWNQGTLYSWLLLAGIPGVLISGLVQEGAKMVPMVVWWWRSDRNISPVLGLAIGAIAGAGFGIFEGFWVHGRLFAAGWTTDAIQTYGFLGIAGFWERFFSIGFHIAASGLAGYGLAKGKGWQFYLIAGGLHSLLNYSAVVMARYPKVITVTRIETFIAVFVVIVAAAVMLIRWRNKDDMPVEQIETGVNRAQIPDE